MRRRTVAAQADRDAREPTWRRWVPWALLSIGVGVALGWGILALPGRLYPPLPASAFVGITPEKRIELQINRQKLQNDARMALLQGVGGAVLLAGAAATWWQIHINRDQLQQNIRATHAQLEATLEQLELSRLAQVTERFTRAMAQLGDDMSIDIRLGGIYALEQTARDSPSDRAAIRDILTAYVRGHSPWPPSKPWQPASSSAVRHLKPLRLRAPAVQACLTVLVRPPLAEATPGLDLADADLRRLETGHADLRGASLARSHLEGARLEDALLDGADLQEAGLDDVELKHASLADVDLRAASLTRACLEGAVMTGAQLDRTVLDAACLAGVDLQHVGGLEGASLRGATADRFTRWPSGFDARAAGVVIEESSH